jgi:predicted nucleotidyltransferase component of viral defense system
MDTVISTMLSQYNCQTDADYENALKQIIQQIVLLGLWRAKFFEHAAFYGGTALRILYQLDRFSEDLDFSLLKVDPEFSLHPYHAAIEEELSSFGFKVEIVAKIKTAASAIESAFLKANTKEHLLKIAAPKEIQQRYHQHAQLKVKIEIDTKPPLNFNTETKSLLQPIPFWVKSYVLPDLFAGKISALLCRQWKNRVKGRDWYDFLWFIQRNTPLNLSHLETRLRAFGYYTNEMPLTKNTLIEMLKETIARVDINLAKQDIVKFIKHSNRLDGWSADIFLTALEELRILP